MSDRYTPVTRKRGRRPYDVGTRFYASRGLPFVSMRTYRERRRDPDAQIAVELNRELTRLADTFPRFRLPINKLSNYVLVQVRSSESKRKSVLRCLTEHRGVSLERIMKSTRLDFISTRSTLEQLEREGQALVCNRNGGPSNPDGKSYWRRAGGFVNSLRKN